MKMEQSVPKRRHIKFRRRGITQKKTYDLILLASGIKAEDCTSKEQIKQNHSQRDLSFSELLDAVLYLRALIQTYDSQTH